MSKPPQDIKLPNEDELFELPRRAIRAYAARCAMRVQPLVVVESFRETDQETIRKHIEAVDIAITISTVVAVSPRTAIKDTVDAVDKAVRAAAYTARDSEATFAAVRAANAAVRTADLSKVNAATDADDAGTNAAAAARDNTASAHKGFIQTARNDYELLLKYSEYPDSVKTQLDSHLWQADEFGNPIPEGWAAVLYHWKNGLHKIGLADIAFRHRRLIDGKGIDLDEAKRHIEDWLSRQVLSSSAKTKKKAQAKKKKAQVKKKKAKKTLKKPVSPAIESDEAVAIEHVVKASPEPNIITNDSVPTHSDEPATIDLLGRKAFARHLAERFRHMYKEEPKGAFLMNLHGPWGSGKTSILNFLRDDLMDVEKSIVESPPHTRWVVVEFNAWENQRSGPAWWPLIDTINRQARAQFASSDRWWQKFKLLWGERLWRLRVRRGNLIISAGIVFLILLLVLMWGFSIDSTPEGTRLTLAVVSLVSAALGVTLTLSKTIFSGAAETAKSFAEVFSDSSGMLSRHFDNTVKRIHEPMLVMIDDLDRCREDYVVEMLETIQTLFRTRAGKVNYIIAADRRWLCECHQNEFASIAAAVDECGRSLGHLFLEKIFQLSASVPRLSAPVLREYWAHLLDLKGEEFSFEQAVAEAEEELASYADERDIVSHVQAVDVASVKGQALRQVAAVKIAAPKIVRGTEHALLPFASLLDPNPRSMKRFVNSYGIQRAAYLLSGINIEVEELALWTILSLRWPVLGERLQRTPALIEFFTNRDKLQHAEDNDELPVPLADLKQLLHDESVRRVIEGEGVAVALSRELLERIFMLHGDGESGPSVE